jgi:hypothetical protein
MNVSFLAYRVVTRYVIFIMSHERGSSLFFAGIRIDWPKWDSETQLSYIKQMYNDYKKEELT